MYKCTRKNTFICIKDETSIAKSIFRSFHVASTINLNAVLELLNIAFYSNMHVYYGRLKIHIAVNTLYTFWFSL